MHKKVIEHKIGKRYGKLVVTEFFKVNEKGLAIWKCKCDCGNENFLISTDKLKKRLDPSCGCDKEEKIKKRYRKNYQQCKYDLSGKHGIGYDTRNRKFYFDLEDYEKIKNYCWYVTSEGYVSSYRRVTEEGKRIQIFLHRFLLNLPDKYNYNDPIGEHINRDPLDNRKQNLRILPSNSENMLNKKIYKNNTSGYRGIRYKNNKWLVRLWYKKENVLCKKCTTLEEAIKIRQEHELKYFGKIFTQQRKNT